MQSVIDQTDSGPVENRSRVDCAESRLWFRFARFGRVGTGNRFRFAPAAGLEPNPTELSNTTRGGVAEVRRLLSGQGYVEEQLVEPECSFLTGDGHDMVCRQYRLVRTVEDTTRVVNVFRMKDWSTDAVPNFVSTSFMSYFHAGGFTMLHPDLNSAGLALVDGMWLPVAEANLKALLDDCRVSTDVGAFKSQEFYLTEFYLSPEI